MSFEGYKYTFKINASHRLGVENFTTAVHRHTFGLALYIAADEDAHLPFYEIESIVEEYLKRYSGNCFNDIPPFDNIAPTIENIGQVLYVDIHSILSTRGFEVVGFEIGETPVSTFVVQDWKEYSRRITDKHSRGNLLLKNIIEISKNSVQSEYRKPMHSLAEELVTDNVSVKQKSMTKMPQEAQEVLPECFYNPPQSSRFWLKFFMATVVLLLCSGALVIYIKNYSGYPIGADIFGHLFKSDLLFHSIQDGDIYPLYTKLWYNGIQPFRYWAPLPYYILALFQSIAGGKAAASYLLFIGFSFFAGAMGWMLWGVRERRVLLFAFLGVLWFFLPDNMRVFFSEGNVPRMTIAIMLPYLVFFIWEFIEQRKNYAIFPIAVIMCMMTLSHVMIAAMVGIATFLFTLIDSIINRRMIRSVQVILGMLTSFAICGIWLFPALQGGLLGMDAAATAEVMKSLSQSITITINPFLRRLGNVGFFYYGISILIVSVIGILFAGKKSRSGFFTAIIVLLGTTTTAVPILSKLPLNQLLWMMRFTTIAYAFFILSIIEWKQCRQYFLLILGLILVLDAIPSANITEYYSQMPPRIDKELEIAKAVTKQRVSILDISLFGSYPSYQLGTNEPKTQYSYGWAWQGASTAKNIVMLNTALESGKYAYMFDRSISLGDDTVIVRKIQVDRASKAPNELIFHANRSGYTLLSETNEAYIFHKKTPESFGVITDYDGIAIGRSAGDIALEFPVFEPGRSDRLDDYSFDELHKYQVIYLSGFTYQNRQKAENLMKQLADAGVRVVIDMNRIPVDNVTNRMTFLDVTSQVITFENKFPMIVYYDQIIHPIPFHQEYKKWNTVYLENVKKPTVYTWFGDKKLVGSGTGENENIVFLGFNMFYHAMKTNDRSVMGLMENMMKFKQDTLPTHELVPIKVQFAKNKIIVDTPNVPVNTTIAFQDNFYSQSNIVNRNNLLYVTQKHTEIYYHYPYFWIGICVSILGILLFSILTYFIYRKKERKECNIK